MWSDFVKNFEEFLRDEITREEVRVILCADTYKKLKIGIKDREDKPESQLKFVDISTEDYKLYLFRVISNVYEFLKKRRYNSAGFYIFVSSDIEKEIIRQKIKEAIRKAGEKLKSKINNIIKNDSNCGGENCMCLSKVVKSALQFLEKKSSEPFSIEELVEHVRKECGTTKINLSRDIRDWFWLMVDLDLIQNASIDKFRVRK